VPTPHSPSPVRKAGATVRPALGISALPGSVA
jgi:hypothetical protein